jgi:hypothetical protein
MKIQIVDDGNSEHEYNSSITRTMGFYPNGSGNPITPKKPSVLGNDGGHIYNVSYTVDLSSGQFNGIYGYIMDYQNLNAGNYNLNTFNCTNFAFGIAMLAGLNLPKTTSSWPLGAGMDPGDFGVDLLMKYPTTNGSNFALLITSGAKAPFDSGVCN